MKASTLRLLPVFRLKKRFFSSTFIDRHIGPREHEIQFMLKSIGAFNSLDEFTDQVIPETIKYNQLQNTSLTKGGLEEKEALLKLKKIMKENVVNKSLLGQGFYNTHTPNVILRNILENPAWYTPYTPYQAEISQGRMEMLLNYQTMIADLTELPYSNCSLLDEGTAAAEAMTIAYNISRNRKKIFVDQNIHPTTLSVVKNRADPLGIEVVTGNISSFDYREDLFGAILQYPGTDGKIEPQLGNIIEKIKENNICVILSTDLLALTLLKSPGELGADIAVGTSQRFGVPLGFGGPHAAFISVSNKNLMRKMPGRIVGVSKDRSGKLAYRLTLQTREQHIKREKATSNICTSQALLANVATAYAIYHGPEGLKNIGLHCHKLAFTLDKMIDYSNLNPHENVLKISVDHEYYFDTLCIKYEKPIAKTIIEDALQDGYNLRLLDDFRITISFDETNDLQDVKNIFRLITKQDKKKEIEIPDVDPVIDDETLLRKSNYLNHKTFNSYHSETDMLRYLYQLQQKDLGLANSMIPLGSCTMKLNATSEMIPISWDSVNNLHPLIPSDQSRGYSKLFGSLENILSEITGFDGYSLQPNSGASGEYAGLRAIKAYHEFHGNSHRNICLIPSSAHGTNPASCAMSGMKIVVIKCTSDGYIDMEDLEEKVTKHSKELGAIMITYPSTFGIFEENIMDICSLVHDHGGQVYMDGANMNAQLGLTSPGFIGADVAHLNLHKTFCIPHGGGGPGVGPIGVKKHLIPFLPSHLHLNKGYQVGPVASAPYGSASILPISWMYLNMMGEKGLKKASQVAILNANYIRTKLAPYYKISYLSRKGEYCAHEFVIDISVWNKYHIFSEDIAKRLMDFGFHAPTMSWPVKECLMIEPTESESMEELDRFIDSMITIRSEIDEIIAERIDYKDSTLYHAPHTVERVCSDDWDRKYSREKAAYPTLWLKEKKFWPSVERLDNSWGDRNLFCSCYDMSKINKD